MSWDPLLAAFEASPEGQALHAFLAQRRAAEAAIYPPEPLRALQLTPSAAVRVVILGQDPYHGPGQAEGLAFSVPPGIKPPPSLRNLFKELARDLGQPAPAHGSLAAWAARGVLLLNTVLTVEDGQPASHAGRGWEALTDALIAHCAGLPQPVVFMLWGAHAQKKAARVGPHHLLLTANHPSPLSATRGPLPFIGCGHFGQAQRWLGERGVAWHWGLEA